MQLLDLNLEQVISVKPAALDVENPFTQELALACSTAPTSSSASEQHQPYILRKAGCYARICPFTPARSLPACRCFSCPPLFSV